MWFYMNDVIKNIGFNFKILINMPCLWARIVIYICLNDWAKSVYKLIRVTNTSSYFPWALYIKVHFLFFCFYLLSKSFHTFLRHCMRNPCRKERERFVTRIIYKISFLRWASFFYNLFFLQTFFDFRHYQSKQILHWF